MKWTREDSIRFRQLRDASMLESEEMLEMVQLLYRRKLCDSNPLGKNPFIEESRIAFIDKEEDSDGVD